MQVTPHWTDTVLAAALAPSGGGEVGASSRAHATECPTCGAALAEAIAAERAVASALEALDHPVPPIGMAQIIARATGPTARSATVVPRTPQKNATRNARGGFPNARRRLRWEAGALLFGIATVAAAAAPRSPIRHLMARLFVSAGSFHSTTPVARPVPPSPTLPSSPRSVAIVPHGPITILFRSTQSTGVIRILSGSGLRVTVRGNGDGATYTVGQDIIMIDRGNTDALSYDVELPPVAQCPDVRIRVGDQLVYSRTRGHVRTDATPDSDGRYVISFAHLVH